MTYLVSLSSAVIRKRTISRSINSLGKHPREIAQKFEKMSTSYREQQVLSLQEAIDKHVVSHQAYPVVHFFSHKNPDDCFNLNFVRLDESLSILLKSNEEKQQHLLLLRGTMTHLLKRLMHKTATLPKPTSPAKFSNPEELDLSDDDLRRQVLTSFLNSEGFDWKDVDPNS